MSGFVGVQSDHVLSDVLSARSYLELAHEGFPSIHERSTSISREHLTPEELIQIDIPPKTHLQPQFGISLQMGEQPEKPQTKPGIKDKGLSERPVRRRGRPRLSTPKDDAAIEGRRLQIRRAQHTYRQKKEATIQALKTRVETLEQTLWNVSCILSDANCDETNALSVVESEKDKLARARHMALVEILGTETFHRESQHSDILESSASRAIDESNELGKQKPNSHRQTYPHGQLSSNLLNRLFPSTNIYTYSHQESDFSRWLQRLCLEQVCRMLTDPRPDPNTMSRVFGLFPCLQDMPGVRRNSLRLLKSSSDGPLETTKKLPFYTLGGASMHYPRTGPDGQPIYPENSRRPGKILRRMAIIRRRGGIQDWDDDWSQDVGVEPEFKDMEERELSDQELLRTLDLEGEWYDCHDVQGYLEHCGIVLDGSPLWPEVPNSIVEILPSLSPKQSAYKSYVSVEEISPDKRGSQDLSSQSTYVLDTECFFELLLANFRLLGRAPGFQIQNINDALQAAIHRRPGH
ncbi:hypothetical protein PISL3812_06759 [Talaromyces islandicus]|uniref:BZIP domain-containing protein n=1 Tax=Talaromyces islandicus TaxID=28573 RepID=A0A0U1M3W4_TALIS|nr:hypothetical protein PISL3812_06759 [Talaromyces islandicus]